MAESVDDVGTPTAPPADAGRLAAADAATDAAADAATDAAADAAPQRPGRRGRLVGWLERFSFAGLVAATVAFCLSMLPSLLPRPTLYVAIVAAVSMALAYGVGVALWWLVRRWWGAPVSPLVRRRAWTVFGVVGPVLYVLFAVLGGQWQDEVRTLVGQDEVGGASVLVIFVLTAVLFVALVSIARGVRGVFRRLGRLLGRWLPRRVGSAVAAALTAILVYWVVSGALLGTALQIADNAYQSRNLRTPEGIVAPTTPLRSGGPGSLVAWDDVGWQGKRFIGSGPTVEQLSEFNGRPATEPIRIYSGLRAADTATERARIAVEELRRTNAFEREVLVVATTTGGGWLEPQAVDALEYLHNGDTAIVAQQYSVLPSWMVFLVDSELASETGRALWDAVWAELQTIPEEDRPQVYAYGLSLGSFGSQAAFPGVESLRASVDGALFVGTPNAAELWRQVTRDRDAGTPEFLPVYRGGEAVRFASTVEQITAPGEWNRPRVLYTQHASDPVTWFSFDLLFEQPDWLREARGPDVSDRTRWFPVITFLQVGVDQFFGTAVPIGYGHNYENLAAWSWAAVAAPDGWTEADTVRLQALIDAYQKQS